MLIKNAFYLLTGLASAGGISLVGVNELTKKTVSDSLNQSKFLSFDDSEKDIWGKLDERIKQESSDPKTDIFKKAKEKIKTPDSSNTSMRSVCFSVLRSTHTSIFLSPDQNILEDAKKFCNITMKEVLGDSNAFSPNTNSQNKEQDSPDKEKIKKKFLELSNHSEGSKKENGVLDESLKTIKEKKKDDSTGDNTWKELLSWCEIRYKNFYSDKQDNEWKLMHKYCKKES